MLLRVILAVSMVMASGPVAAGSRVSGPAGASPAPPGLQGALESLAAACERGDRGGFVALLAEESRRDAAPLADALLSRPGAVLGNVRIEIVSLAQDGSSGALLLLATGAPLKATGLPSVPEGFARAAPGSRAASLLFDARTAPGGRTLLALRHGTAAGVARLAAQVRLDAKPPRARSTARLELTSSPRVALLAVGASASVRGRGGVVLTPVERLLGEEMGGVRVEWPDGAERGVVELEADVPLPDGAVRGTTVVLLHQSQVIPFAGGGHFRYELTLDVPLPNRSVSVGLAEELPSEDGRRRTRWTCDRAVDYLPLAAGPYEVTSDGEGAERLELWRTRDVGGDPKAILAELRELVTFQEERVAPLPYRAFRLVDLPTTEGLAVSYASMIFMAPDMLAAKELRAEILSHEIGHQWWGNAVSPDPTARWAAEGMADAMKDLFVRRRFGEERWLDRQDAHRRAVLAQLGIASRPLGSSPGGPAAYDRGALFVHALHAELGEELFWRVLRRWFARLAGATPRTEDFRREAEAEAGRPLGAIFEPWLGTTALPVLSLDWTARAPGASVTIRQDAPAFPLSVPLRAIAADGRTHEWTQRADGLQSSSSEELPFVPRDVELDPGRLLPRVLSAELDAYERAEAAACLARGDAVRARMLLQRLQSRSLLDPPSAIRLFAASVLTGVPAATARPALDAVLAEIPDAATRRSSLLAAADELLEQGAPEAALPILAELDAQVTEGAAAPRRLGLALRALGREDEARAAFRRALQRRPDDAESLAALGQSPAPSAETKTPPLQALLPADDARLKASSPEGTRVLALTGGRFAVLLSGPRALLIGVPGRLAALPAFAPVGALDVVAIVDAPERSVLAVLETSRQKSRLTIVEVARDGSARVAATHDRCPGSARGLVALPGGGLAAAWAGAESRWDWRKLRVPPGVSSGGPDDDDGLKRIQPKDDDRWEPFGTSDDDGGRGAVALPGLGVVTISEDGKRLAGSAGVAWESAGASDRVISARPWREGVALVVAFDAGGSPFAEDRREALRLLAISGEDVIEADLPGGTTDASLSGDGGLAIERTPSDASDARLQCGAVEVSGSRP